MPRLRLAVVGDRAVVVHLLVRLLVFSGCPLWARPVARADHLLCTIPQQGEHHELYGSRVLRRRPCSHCMAKRHKPRLERHRLHIRQWLWAELLLELVLGEESKADPRACSPSTPCTLDGGGTGHALNLQHGSIAPRVEGGGLGAAAAAAITSSL